MNFIKEKKAIWMPFLLLLFIALIYVRAYGGNGPGPGHRIEGGGDDSSVIEFSDDLPWDGDASFEAAKTDYETPLLLAKFEFTLIDPLPGELHNVKLAISELKGAVLQPGEIFSQNTLLGPYTKEKGYQKGLMFFGTQIREATGGGVCKVATLLYNIACLVNLQIIERHNHSMPVLYVPFGQDATVAYGHKDLRFKNNTDETLLIWADVVGETPLIAIYGKTAPPKVSWEHYLSQESLFQKIYLEDSNLPRGTEKLFNQGINGCVVESKLVIEHHDGSSTEKPMGKSRYNPMPEIILRGTGE